MLSLTIKPATTAPIGCATYCHVMRALHAATLFENNGADWKHHETHMTENIEGTEQGLSACWHCTSAAQLTGIAHIPTQKQKKLTDYTCSDDSTRILIHECRS